MARSFDEWQREDWRRVRLFLAGVVALAMAGGALILAYADQIDGWAR